MVALANDTRALPRSCLGEEQWEAFARDGFLRLGAVCAPDLLERLRSRIDAIMMGEHMVNPPLYMQVCPSSMSSTWADSQNVAAGAAPPRTLAYRKIMGLEGDDVFRGYMLQPLFEHIATRVCGRDVAIVRAMFFNKPKERGKVIDWHQDREEQNMLPQLRPALGDANITMWTALDPSSTESGCLQVIAGSHKFGAVPFGPTSADAPTLSRDQLRHFAPEDRRVELEMDAGECVLLHNLLLHKSGLNGTGQPRRAFSTWLTSHRPGTEHFATAFPAFRPNLKHEPQGRDGGGGSGSLMASTGPNL